MASFQQALMESVSKQELEEANRLDKQLWEKDVFGFFRPVIISSSPLPTLTLQEMPAAGGQVPGAAGAGERGY